MQTLTHDIRQVEFYIRNNRIDDAKNYLSKFDPNYNNKILLRLNPIDQAKLLEYDQ